MLHGCYGHYHIGSEDGTVRAFEALRLYLKYLTHKHSVLGSLYITVPAFAKTANHLLLGAKIRKICESNKSIMVHNEKNGVNSLKQIRVLSTFQFTRFQLTELNSLLVSTRLSCFSAS